VARKFGIKPSLQFDPALRRFLWQVTVPFALAGIFSRVYSYIDSIMLSKLVSETAVGFYGVAYKLAFAFQFLPMAFAAAIYPAMSGYYVSDRQRLNATFSSAMTYLLLLVTPIAFGISALAEPIIRLVYGPAFLGSVVPLQILILSLFFAFLYWPAGSLLNACDRQASNTKIMGLTMAVNIVLNAILVPRLEAIGAAIAAFIGNAVLFFGALLMTRGLARLEPETFHGPAVKIMGSGLLMSLVVTQLAGRLPVAADVAVGAAVYVGALFATRAVTFAQTKAFLVMFLRRGKAVSDVSAA
jgi:O-antigen/teichoic acid export membrane protein